MLKKPRQMLACDIFETFRLASKEGPESVKVVGKRSVKSTFILTLGILYYIW